MRYRVISFEVDGKQHFTLVQEWLNDEGKVVRDSRQQMTKKQFLRLRKAVNEVELSYAVPGCGRRAARKA